MDTGIISYLFDSYLSFQSPLAGGSPAATHLSFASPKESKQRKGDPTVCVPSLRYGQPAVLSQNGVRHKLATLKQVPALIRFVFRSSAHTEGLGGQEYQSQKSENRTPQARHGAYLFEF
jgi:hypothetical protein